MIETNDIMHYDHRRYLVDADVNRCFEHERGFHNKTCRVEVKLSKKKSKEEIQSMPTKMQG